jgi:hypothetical protein
MVHKSLNLRIIETLARRWWFLAPILLLQFIPPYTSRSYDLSQWTTINAYILTHPIKSTFSPIYPIFQVTTLILVGTILIAGGRVTRIFNAYVALSYAAMAFLQNISIGDRYGLGICVSNLLTFLILAGMWSWEAIFPKNELVPRKQPVWKYWGVLLALIPFWEPANPQTLLPDFNPTYILTSGAGLSFCLATPLYLAVLGLYFLHVNKTLFVATSLVGFFLSLGNMALEFVIYPNYWWIGGLHIPLFIISVYSLGLSLKDTSTLERMAQFDPKVSQHVSNP